jgi:hypothetical protein
VGGANAIQHALEAEIIRETGEKAVPTPGTELVHKQALGKYPRLQIRGIGISSPKEEGDPGSRGAVGQIFNQRFNDCRMGLVTGGIFFTGWEHHVWKYRHPAGSFGIYGVLHHFFKVGGPGYEMLVMGEGPIHHFLYLGRTEVGIRRGRAGEGRII